VTDSNCRRWMVLSDREATGEPMTELERQWYEQHAAACADCAGEARFWAALGEVMSKPEVLNTTLLPTSVGSVPGSSARRWPRLRPLTGWFLAAAASVVLVVSGGVWLRQRPKAAAPVAVTPTINFVAVAGETRVGSKSVRVGEVFGSGERLRTEQGRACFALDTSILACLDANSEASVSTLEPNVVSVRLERGRLMSRLERQPAGRRYVVMTSKASVTAKGTEFVVGVDAEQRVAVHLHEGQLALLALAHQDRDIRAPSAVVIEDTIADVAWSDAVVAADRDLLQLTHLSHDAQPLEKPTELDVTTRPQGASVMVDDMLLGPTPASASIRGGRRLVVSMPGFATVTELLPTQPGERLQRNYELAELPVAAAASADESGTKASESTAAAETPASNKTKAPTTAPVTPRGMLAQAQALRREGKLRECADAYRQLVSGFPSSDEARVALVSLGELELGVLSQPAQALRSFETYLQQPGPLTREARFGRIRALQMLSRKADEQVAIGAFLRDYPNSVQAERLRRRSQSR
jgi:hypothetical protein